MLRAAPLDRAYVNNGGDIALHLADGEQFTVGLMDRPDRHGLMRTMIIDADDPARGIATSGRHGRSFSLGIADAVTVLARTASQADAAATIIANAVDLPAIPPSSAARPMNCSPTAISARALSPGMSAHCRIARSSRAEGRGRPGAALLAAGLIEGAALRLQGETAVVGASGIRAGAMPAFHGSAM